jgi:hypothetical protein
MPRFVALAVLLLFAAAPLRAGPITFDQINARPFPGGVGGATLSS